MLSMRMLNLAVENDIKVLTSPTVGAHKLLGRIIENIPGLLQQLYAQELELGQERYTLWGSIYGVNEPYPKKLKKALRRLVEGR